MQNLHHFLGEKRSKDIEEEVGKVIEQIREHGWKDLRTAAEFFSLFKVPELNKRILEQRVLTNYMHYRSNYLVICAGMFLIRIIFAPFLLLCILAVTTCCLYLLFGVTKPIVVGEVVINTNGKRIICGFCSLIFLAVCGALEKLLWTAMYCILLCALHMIFRPRSVTSKSGKLYDELKLNGFNWFGGEASLEEEDPESGLGTSPDDGTVQAVTTFPSVRKRAAPTSTTPHFSNSVNSAKNS
jgi:PRA1 family protein